LTLFASEYAPVALLKNPLVLLKSDKTPVAVLKPPLISLKRARRPVAVFWLPTVRGLSASKPVPVFQTPAVRLTSTPIPSPLLAPGMVPSVSGPTARAVWQSATQARNAEARTGGIVVLKLINVFRGVLIFSCMVSERLVGFLKCTVFMFFYLLRLGSFDWIDCNSLTDCFRLRPEATGLRRTGTPFAAQRLSLQVRHGPDSLRRAGRSPFGFAMPALRDAQ